MNKTTGILWRVMLSVILIGAAYMASMFLGPREAALHGHVAVQMLNADLDTNAANQAALNTDATGWIRFSAYGLVAVLWLHFLALHFIPVFMKKTGREECGSPGDIRKVCLAFATLLLLSLPGCTYQEEKFEDIGPNENAFLIPLSGGPNDQTALNGISYLEQKKVPTKRVRIPTEWHQTGYWGNEGSYIATAKLIRVDRTPITREWTDSEKTGTNTKDDAISVESLESINFSMGVSITVSITEKNTPAFLYNFAGKSLPIIVDSTIRSSVQAFMAEEFGKLTFTECLAKKVEISQKCFKHLNETYTEKGITIESFGIAGGLTFDSKIQAAINQKFIAANDLLVAQEEQKAAVTRNLIAVSKAKADAEAADFLEKSAEGLRIKMQLEMQISQMAVLKSAAEKWDGKMPANIVPAGSQLLFGFDRPIEVPRSTK